METSVQLPNKLKGRIIKRHGFATTFYAFLMIISASTPIVSLFFTNLGIKYGENDFVSMNGIDVFKGFAFQSNPILEFVSNNANIFGPFAAYSFLIFLGLALLLCWPLCVSLIQICKALKLIFYGQSTHMARPICTSFFAFFSLLFFNAGCIAISVGVNYFSSKASLDVVTGVNLVQFIFTGIQLGLFLFMIIFYAICFANKAYIYEIDLDAYEEDIILDNIKPIEAKGIDTNNSYIADHQYSKTDIFYAHIPIGVTSIGNGAFSNCVHLRSLFIPRSVKKIGANAFFNCQSLNEIVYNGTKGEWSRIVRGSNWLLQAGTNLVKCKDGTISVSVIE